MRVCRRVHLDDITYCNLFLLLIKWKYKETYIQPAVIINVTDLLDPEIPNTIYSQLLWHLWNCNRFEWMFWLWLLIIIIFGGNVPSFDHVFCKKFNLLGPCLPPFLTLPRSIPKVNQLSSWKNVPLVCWLKNDNHGCEIYLDEKLGEFLWKRHSPITNSLTQ